MGKLQKGRVLFCRFIHALEHENAISKSSFVKLYIFSPPFRRDHCPSGFDKAQETTGAMGLAVTPSSPPSLVLKYRQIVKGCAAPTKLLQLVLGTYIQVAQSERLVSSYPKEFMQSYNSASRRIRRQCLQVRLLKDTKQDFERDSRERFWSSF